MADIVLDSNVLTHSGSVIRTTGQAFPSVVQPSGGTAGRSDVDAAIGDLFSSARSVLLGAAAEVFQVGQRAITAAELFGDVDRRLR